LLQQLKTRIMKTFAMNKLQTIFSLLFLAWVLPACSEIGNSEKESSQKKPSVDIHTAVLYGNLAAVKEHIAYGTDLNQKEPMGGSTPLISAATFNKMAIAQALIDAGADLSIQNNDGTSALHAAAFFGRVEMVQMLIDAKADKSLKNNFGTTAREAISGPFAEMKPIYEMMQQQLGPLGLELDFAELEKSRPVIAIMLQ
jgi:hypothetical protein